MKILWPIAAQISVNISSLILIILGLFFINYQAYVEIQVFISIMAFAGFLHVGSIDGQEYRYIKETNAKILNDNIIFHFFLISIVYLTVFLYLDSAIKKVAITAGYIVILSSVFVSKLKYLDNYQLVAKVIFFEKLLFISTLLIILLVQKNYFLKIYLLFVLEPYFIKLFFNVDFNHRLIIDKYRQRLIFIN